MRNGLPSKKPRNVAAGHTWNNKAIAGQWAYSVCGADHQTGNSNLIETSKILLSTSPIS